MSYHYHGVQRQVFVAPLASNSQSYLRGKANGLQYYEQDAATMIAFFTDRWLIPRAERLESYKNFDPTSYLLWHDSEMNPFKKDQNDPE